MQNEILQATLVLEIAISSNNKIEYIYINNFTEIIAELSTLKSNLNFSLEV